MAENNKTRFFYVLYSDKTRVFDQSERAYYPIYIIISNTKISHLCEANYVILMTKLKIQGINTRDGPDWSRGREQDMTRQHDLSETCLSKYVMALFTSLNSQYSLSFYSA